MSYIQSVGQFPKPRMLLHVVGQFPKLGML